MDDIRGQLSSSGVFVAEDFRDNLIIDRYDARFATMRMSKKKHLRSENSEDAISWNVFRSLRQVSPAVWVPELFRKAGFGVPPGDLSQTTVDLWKYIPPPSSLLTDGDEGDSEIDVVLENPQWVCFIEAKYTSDISERTTTRSNRDQVLRNIDVGSSYAGARDFYFALLVLDRRRSPKGMDAVERYRNFEEVRRRLPHRRDSLRNLAAVSSLLWADFTDIINVVKCRLSETDEAVFAARVFEWMAKRKIGVVVGERR